MWKMGCLKTPHRSNTWHSRFVGQNTLTSVSLLCWFLVKIFALLDNWDDFYFIFGHQPTHSDNPIKNSPDPSIPIEKNDSPFITNAICDTKQLVMRSTSFLVPEMWIQNKSQGTTRWVHCSSVLFIGTFENADLTPFLWPVLKDLAPLV